MTVSLSPKNLAKIAARAAGHPAFCGWALAQYAESEGIDLAEVARLLGASAEAMARLHLCLRPAENRFADDVKAIAAHVGVNADVLATFLRRADVIDRLRAGPANPSAGTLMAARGRPAPKKPTHRRKDTP